MTLTETLLAASALAMLMLIVAVGVDQVRTDLKRRQVEQTLVLLDRALHAYQHETGDWPEPGDPENGSAPAAGCLSPTERSAIDVLAALRSVDTSRAVVDEVPACLRRPNADPTSSPNDDTDATAHEFAMLVDAWGHPLHCLTRHSPANVQRMAVAANGGCPIFISAGSDALFDSEDGSAAGDNIRSSEVIRPEIP